MVHQLISSLTILDLLHTDEQKFICGGIDIGIGIGDPYWLLTWKVVTLENTP